MMGGAKVGETAEFDDRAAVIFSYFAVGNDDNPSASVTTEQFTRQIEELTSGGYTVKPLPEIIDAFASGKQLPPRTIAITFDGADKSILQNAIPLLEKNDLPFTVFIPADRVASGKPPFMNWNDLRRLKRSGLASFGLHPSYYSRLADDDADEIKRQINNSLAAIRKELGINPTLLAYPYGEYDEDYQGIVKSMGLKAAFGQNSGVAHAGEDRYALPRFTLTERYGDMDRFLMTANALPFPVIDVSPADPHLSTLNPAIGFTVPESLAKSVKNISCFSSSEEKPKLEILGTRIEIRLSQPFSESRPRINCTLAAAPAPPGEEPRFRWLGMMYSVPQDLLNEAAIGTKEKPEKHARDGREPSINME